MKLNFLFLLLLLILLFAQGTNASVTSRHHYQHQSAQRFLIFFNGERRFSKYFRILLLSLELSVQILKHFMLYILGISIDSILNISP